MEMKYQNGVEKALLRDAFRDLLPPELLHRKKSPYPKTYHPGYEKILIARMTDILADSNASILPLIDKKKAKKIYGSTKRIRKAVVRAAYGGSTASGLFYPAQLLDGEISSFCVTEKNTPALLLCPGCFLYIMILKLFCVFSDTPCIPALRSVSP